MIEFENYVNAHAEDSGIDSENERQPEAGPDYLEYQNVSDSEVDQILKRNNNELIINVTDSEDELDPLNNAVHQPCRRQSKWVRFSKWNPDRDSPPLLEVELTASEEEDDASVLELVIPMQKKPKYQMVPRKVTRNRRPFWHELVHILCCIRIPK